MHCFLLGSVDGDGGGERGDDLEGTGAGDEHGSLKIALSLLQFTCAVLHAFFGLSLNVDRDRLTRKDIQL